MTGHGTPADGVGGLDGSPYQDYLYGYPHKTAYRPLRPRPALREVWAGQSREALMLYLHLPFCEMRCGFCNLFTRSNPPADQVRAYLDQVHRQAARVAGALGDDTRFARVAVGGGTPTYLDADELSSMFDLIDRFRPAGTPTAVETSPATATADRLAVLRDRGTTRISIGVQSFLDVEARAAGRPQRRTEVERALAAIRDQPFDELNIDLIYGIPGQTRRTWEQSLTAALRWTPEELFLYPLYVRPLTGLSRRAAARRDRSADAPAADAPAADAPVDLPDPAWDHQRQTLYRQGVDRLRAAGYRQLSMRHFRRSDLPVDATPEYACQSDGMVGLGCGARSYTADLHYSFDYAVGVGRVRAIIDDYLRRPESDFDHAEVGYRLDADEQRRRWLITSLLRADGCDQTAYADRFGSRAVDDFPQLAVLADRGWLTATADRLALTAAGLARSDAVGPWLVSTAVRAAMIGRPAK
ncbi:STM4012 family radical SAM protein [Solwaraspora sp. WMMD791]|uniref:STM4012 family radical SAM protein n=1 Tax=Solwaraspora sp. WMMD791 TaxID=3016086 RepID=UPI00249A89E5|nr:STM4012 family radical SAM protein [Solwaraspora sp. WMMD791]WFE29173.1 STM4012 family radical SAM protein [Solwaraspora sp. WMMD791]